MQYKDESAAFKAGVLQKCAELGLDKSEETIVSEMLADIADTPDFMTHLKSAAGTYAGDTEDLPTGVTGETFANLLPTAWQGLSAVGRGIASPFNWLSDRWGQSMGNKRVPLDRPSGVGLRAKRRRLAIPPPAPMSREEEEAGYDRYKPGDPGWIDAATGDVTPDAPQAQSLDEALAGLDGQFAPKPPAPAPTPPAWMTGAPSASPANGSYVSTYPGDQPAVAAAPPAVPAAPAAPVAPPPPPKYVMTNQGRQQLLPQEQRGIFTSPETQRLMAANRTPKVKWQPGAPGGLPPEQAVAATTPPAPMDKPSSAHARALVGHAIKESIANVLNGLQGKQWQPAAAPSTFKTPAAGKIPAAPAKGKPAKPATPATPKYSGTSPAPTAAVKRAAMDCGQALATLLSK